MLPNWNIRLQQHRHKPHHAVLLVGVNVSNGIIKNWGTGWGEKCSIGLNVYLGRKTELNLTPIA